MSREGGMEKRTEYHLLKVGWATSSVHAAGWVCTPLLAAVSYHPAWVVVYRMRCCQTEWERRQSVARAGINNLPLWVGANHIAAGRKAQQTVIYKYLRTVLPSSGQQPTSPRKNCTEICSHKDLGKYHGCTCFAKNDRKSPLRPSSTGININHEKLSSSFSGFTPPHWLRFFLYTIFFLA